MKQGLLIGALGLVFILASMVSVQQAAASPEYLRWDTIGSQEEEGEAAEDDMDEDDMAEDEDGDDEDAENDPEGDEDGEDGENMAGDEDGDEDGAEEDDMADADPEPQEPERFDPGFDFIPVVGQTIADGAGNPTFSDIPVLGNAVLDVINTAIPGGPPAPATLLPVERTGPVTLP